jgi:hypothetical protein
MNKESYNYKNKINLPKTPIYASLAFQILNCYEIIIQLPIERTLDLIIVIITNHTR